MSMSAAICIYNDFDFIEDCIAKIYDSVDEIVILDGPYHYCEPILTEFGLHYDGVPDALRGIVALDKVRYEYRTFENEKSKRMALYEMCRCDIVMLLDSDELITGIDADAIAEFKASAMAVAPARIHNHVRSAVLTDKDKRKFIFFKRALIGALEHLNYTWLVGVEQAAPDQSIMFQTPLMDMAHLTLMRSPFFNVVKFCFYTRLYFYSRGNTEELTRLFGIPFAELHEIGLDIERIKEIFRRSTPALVNFTEMAPLQPADGTLETRFDDVLDLTPIGDASEVVILGRVESYHYLDLPPYLRAGDTVHFSCDAANITALDARIVIHNGQECRTLPCEIGPRQGDLLTGHFTLPFATANLFGTLIHFKAPAAQDRQIGRITNFRLKKHVAIYGNCQTENLRDFLETSEAFNRRFVFEVTPGRLAHMMTPDEARALHGVMHRVDYVITQPIDKSFRGDAVFGTETLLDHVRADARVFMMPNLFFTGYAPEAYCVTYRKKFMQSPMPIHDVNMIYSFVKHRGNRDAAKSDFVQKLLDENFYKKKFLLDNVRKNIENLAHREKAAAAAYPGANIRHFAYSTFLEAHHDKALTHYSDAHPTEYVFTELAKIVLADLGIEDDLTPPVLGEKGVLPFYHSVGRQFGFDAVSQPIMVNNREVNLNEFFDLYGDAYDKIEADELFGYISGHVVKVIVTNHKTGTMLMAGIIRKYCEMFNLRLLELNAHFISHDGEIDTTVDFQAYDVIFVNHAQHFEHLITAVPYLRYRAVHLIRNPFEIIMSGVRYHQKTDEVWCNLKLFVKSPSGICGFERVAAYNAEATAQVGDYTYREIMNLLSEHERIEFEIGNHVAAFGTIPKILNLMRRFRGDANLSTIRLEDIATPDCIAHVFKFLNLNEAFLPIYTEMVGGKEWLGRHVTNRDGGITYLAEFDDALFALFAREFGDTILKELGYATAEAPSLAGNENTNVAPVQPGRLDGAQAYASALYKRADRVLSEGRLEEARELLERSLELMPDALSTLGRLGDICVRTGAHEDAVAYYERLEALPIDKPEWAASGLATARRALREAELSLQAAKPAAAKNDDITAATLYAQAEKQLGLGQLEEAKLSFQQALALAPEDASTLGRLGDLCVRTGVHDEAIAYYRRLEALPMAKPAWLYIGLANAQQALAQKAEAAASLRKALSLGAPADALGPRLAALEQA
jgi:tetratricopeptide (TPR) repeat protein